MPRRNRDLEKTYTASQFAAKLRRFADAVERGRAFPIMVAGERLHIPRDAVFNVEHERQGREEELEFQVRWTVPTAPRVTSRQPTRRASARGGAVRGTAPKKRRTQD
jgi:amphi-Trp domain-containing protein